MPQLACIAILSSQVDVKVKILTKEMQNVDGAHQARLSWHDPRYLAVVDVKQRTLTIEMQEINIAHQARLDRYDSWYLAFVDVKHKYEMFYSVDVIYLSINKFDNC